jgi:hypothetical protein
MIISLKNTEYAGMFSGSSGCKFISGKPHLNRPRARSMKDVKTDEKLNGF